MKRFILAWLLLLATATSAAAQSVLVPSPVPALTNGCTLMWQTATSTWICAAPGAASQPLTDSVGLIADNADATKILALQLSGITTGTTRTWTIPDANITFPTTLASLAANTFTGLQTMNGGLSATTGLFSSTLGVTGVATFASAPQVQIAATSIANVNVSNNGGAGGYTYVIAERAAGGTVAGWLPYASIYGSGNDYPVQIVQDNTPYLTVAIGGNVGIGTTGPDRRLDVLATTTQFRLTYTDGTAYTDFTTSVGGDLTIAPSGGDTTVAARLAVSGFGAHTFSAGGTGSNQLGIRNTSAGAANIASVEVGNDTSDGAAIIRAYSSTFTTSGYAVANGTAILASLAGGLSIAATHASGAIRFYAGGTTLRAQINTNGTQTWAPYGAGTATFDASGNITSVSDARFKDRVSALPYGLAEVLALRPVQHGYNELSGLEREHLYGGFLAQEVQAIMPLAVGVAPDGYLTLSDRPIIGALVNAAKTHDARIRQLEAEIARLKEIR